MRLLRAMDVQAFDTAVAEARRRANNAMTAARAGGKVLQANPFFVRARRARARQAEYEFWKAEQQREWREERMRRQPVDSELGQVPDEAEDGFWSE